MSSNSALPNQPPRTKKVYGAPRLLAPDNSPALPSTESPVASIFNRKSIFDQLAEIDQLPDDELPQAPEIIYDSQPEIRDGGAQEDEQEDEADTTLRPASSQPEPSLAPSQAPTSLSKSLVASGSPSSHGPVTPCDLSPLVGQANHQRRKRLFVDSDDDDDSLPSAMNKSNSRRRLSNFSAEIRLDDADSLSDIDFADILEERARAEANAESELKEEQPEPAPPTVQGTSIKSRAKRLASPSDTESTSVSKTKAKKLKGLNKRDKDEVNRHLAAMVRQKDVRLVGACKQPNTSLDDMLAKLTRANSSASSAYRRSQNKPRHQKVPKAIITSSEQPEDPIETPLTSPIGDYPLRAGSSIDSIEKTDERMAQPSDLHDNTGDDDLPDVDDLFDNSKTPVVPHPRPDIVASASKLQNMALTARKQALTQADASAKPKGKNREVIQLGGSDGSDTDLEIVDLPATLTGSSTYRPSGFASLSSTTRSALATFRPNSKGKTPVVSRTTSRVSSSIERQPKGPLQNNRFMQDLRSKSALENARERQRKQKEFAEQGGRVLNPIHLKNPSANLGSGNPLSIKDIMSKAQADADADEEGTEDEDDADWGEGPEEEDTERGSGSDMGSGEEQDNEEDEEDELGEDTKDADDHTESDTQPVPAVAHEPTDNSELPSLPQHQPSPTNDCRQPIRKFQLVDSPEPDQNDDLGPVASPFNFTGFAPPAGALAHSNVANSADKDKDLDLDDGPLPGFGSLADGGGSELTDSPLPGFGGSTSVTSPPPSAFAFSQSQLPSQLVGESFTQLFNETEGSTFTHPPPLLKEIRASAKTNPNRLLSNLDDDEGFTGTCVLPGVKVSREEQERDMMAMMLARPDDEGAEDEEAPMQYVNDRGLLTQNKPSVISQCPPDSPLWSQDMVARTPFALRKDRIEFDPIDNVRRNSFDDVHATPTVVRKLLPRITVEDEVDEEEHDAPKDKIGDAAPVAAQDAFAVLMRPHPLPALAPQKSPKTRLNRRIFLADQADESDEEDGILKARMGPDEDEDDEDSDAARSVYEALVDDAEDQRDEKTKLEGEVAMEELLKQQAEEEEAKHAAQIQKVIAGRLRKKQAGKNRGEAGISDSDSEDDEEAERIRANKRAQEQLHKKKNRAIHNLAIRHESFYKSYEEGTTQWVDDDDLACLQPVEEDIRESDSSEDEDDENPAPQRISIREAELLAVRKSRERSESDVEEAEPQAEVAFNLASSPIRHVKLKINDPLTKKPVTLAAQPTGFSTHTDLDGLYNTKQFNKLSARQMSLKVDVGRDDGANGGSSGGGTGPSKSSSITYQSRQQQSKSHANPDAGKTRKAPVVMPSGGGGLAKLKSKKSGTITSKRS